MMAGVAALAKGLEPGDRFWRCLSRGLRRDWVFDAPGYHSPDFPVGIKLVPSRKSRGARPRPENDERARALAWCVEQKMKDRRSYEAARAEVASENGVSDAIVKRAYEDSKEP
jgi:hypothetical protein